MTEESSENIYGNLTALVQYAVDTRHRYLVVLEGEYEWAVNIVETFLTKEMEKEILFVSENRNSDFACIPQAQIEQLLGQEFDYILYDARSGFFANALCIAEGLLKGGGLLFLLVPPFGQWPETSDVFHKQYAMYPYTENDMQTYFINRFVGLIRKNETVSIISQIGETRFYSTFGREMCTKIQASETSVFASPSQKAAVEEILHVASGHRNRPLVILANRGHGKTSALGIACAHLLQKNELKRILVTAPRKSSTDILFSHANKLLHNGLEINNGRIEYNGSTIEFIAPDALVQSPQSCHLLLVDEASAIPSPILESLLNSYHRMVFSTTVYGYEGNGRGFELKFMQKMKQLMPGSSVIRIDDPVRWNRGDPLEAFFYDTFLLNAEPVSLDTELLLSRDKLQFVKLDCEKLIKNESKLKSLYGLLHNAHYKTTPNDLRMMLDSPYISIYAYCSNESIIAAALISDEGSLDDDITLSIYEGSRRIKGHHLPQTLIQEFGDKGSASLKYARIIRLAVNPEYQGKGIGSDLLKRLWEETINHYDIVGAVFGCEHALLNFWAKNGYTLVKLGQKKNAYSGYHSAVVLLPVSDICKSNINNLQRLSYEKLSYAFTDSLRNLDYKLVNQVLHLYRNLIDDEFYEHDFDVLQSFVQTHRQFDVCAPSLFRLLMISIKINILKELDQHLLKLMLQRIVQRKSEKEVVTENGLHGQKELIDMLRQATGKLFNSIDWG